MDELVHHCIQEIAFDGDFGCDVSRLRDFVSDFYSQNASTSSTSVQNVDDAFCTFVWSVIVQQPGVRVGTIPPGASTEVCVAPQPSTKPKGKSKGEEETQDLLPAVTLNIIPDAVVRPAEDLKIQFSYSPSEVDTYGLHGSPACFSRTREWHKRG